MTVAGIIGGVVATVATALVGKAIVGVLVEDDQVAPVAPPPAKQPMMDLLGVIPVNPLTVQIVHTTIKAGTPAPDIYSTLKTGVAVLGGSNDLPPGTVTSLTTGKETKCRTSWFGYKVYSGTFPRSKTFTRPAPERECQKGSPAAWWKNCVDGCWTDDEGPMIYRGPGAANSTGGWNWANSVSIEGGGTGLGTTLTGGGWDDLATVLWSLALGLWTGGVGVAAFGIGSSAALAIGTTASGTMAAIGKTIADAQKGKIDPKKAVKIVTDLTSDAKKYAQDIENFTSLGFGE